MPIQAPIAYPSKLVRSLTAGVCALRDCPDAVEYLDSRYLWPHAAKTSLRAHSSAPFYEKGELIGRYPALVASVRDQAGELVTLHVTYLQHGRKLAHPAARKILSPMTGRTGCAVRLMPITSTLGVGEGLETCLAASILHEMPVWAALNTSLLQRFQPPPGVAELFVFADNDPPGLAAAARLAERLRDTVSVEVRTPQHVKDWADILEARIREHR